MEPSEFRFEPREIAEAVAPFRQLHRGRMVLVASMALNAANRLSNRERRA